MKKLLTLVCLLGLLSVPSVVFAEGPCAPGEMSEDASAEEMMEAKQAAMNSAECTRSRVSAVESAMASGAVWYGSLRVGVTSSATAGLADGGSRFGVMGSSEVSEGLTAIYQFEHGINSTNANLGESGRLAYVGLSGGFGSLTLGQIGSASYNGVGAITDNSNYLGDAETGGSRHGNAVSYAVSVENISMQVDVIMNNGGGARSTPDTHTHAIGGSPVSTDATNANNTSGNAVPTSAAAKLKNVEDKNVDAFHLGVSMGLGENGKIGFAHISHDTAANVKKKSNFIAGQYTIGSMTAYLGVAQHKTEDQTPFAEASRPGGPDARGVMNPAEADGEDITVDVVRKQTESTTFAGIRGSVGDTGLTYLFQARSKKTKGDKDVYSAGENGVPVGADVATAKHTPWMMGLYRSLGGGATVMFEHGNPDKAGMKSTSHLALKIDF